MCIRPQWCSTVAQTVLFYSTFPSNAVRHRKFVSVIELKITEHNSFEVMTKIFRPIQLTKNCLFPVIKSSKKASSLDLVASQRIRNEVTQTTIPGHHPPKGILLNTSNDAVDSRVTEPVLESLSPDVTGVVIETASYN